MTRNHISLAVCLLLAPRAAFAIDAPAKMPQPQSYVAYRTVGPITIDGKLDDESWERVPWTSTFVDIEGTAKPLPRFNTRAKMLWDDTYFYIAARLDEPHVWGTITKHDEVIFQDNDFEFFIDPDGDNHEYYEFEINALNTGWDLFLKAPYRDGGPADNSWEIPGLRTAVFVDGTLNRSTDQDRGWSVELAVPWKALEKYAHKPCPPEDGDQWRVNFSRVEWKHVVKDGKYEKVPNTKEDNWVWSPQGVVDMHRPERWGYVQFSRGEIGKVRPRIDPTSPARDALHDVYYAQKKYFEANKTWAKSLEQLGIDSNRRPPIVLKSTPDGYEAMAVVPIGVTEIQPVILRPNSKITLGPKQQAPAVK